MRRYFITLNAIGHHENHYIRLLYLNSLEESNDVVDLLIKEANKFGALKLRNGNLSIKNNYVSAREFISFIQFLAKNDVFISINNLSNFYFSSDIEDTTHYNTVNEIQDQIDVYLKNKTIKDIID
jgi:hypothetical protein